VRCRRQLLEHRGHGNERRSTAMGIGLTAKWQRLIVQHDAIDTAAGGSYSITDFDRAPAQLHLHAQAIERTGHDGIYP
jgi:hypothetical protein